MPPQPITVDGWGGGMNTRVPPVDIADDELADARNIELDGTRSLISRTGTASQSGAYTFGSQPVNGLFHYRNSLGTVSEVLAGGPGELAAAPAGTTTWASIEGAYTVDATVARWEFAVLADTLFISNMRDNLRTWDGVAANWTDHVEFTAISQPRSIATMDNRLWVVDDAAPNTLRYSTLGAPLDFTTTGKAGAGAIEVGGAEGDAIRRILPHRGRLFMFKERMVYVLAPGNPRTDSEQFSIIPLLTGIGLAAPDATAVVRDDVYFLSDLGLLSLRAAEAYGDWQQADLSYRIPELREWPKGQLETVRMYTHPTKSQLFLAVPFASGDTRPTRTWVLDYTDPQRPAWTYFDGDYAARSFATVTVSGTPSVYMGDDIVYSQNDAVYNDRSVAYTKYVKTKSFSFGESMRRKVFHRFGAQFEALTTPLEVQVYHTIDNSDLRRKLIDYDFSSGLEGAEWDVDLWDTGEWSTELEDIVDLVWPIRGRGGRKGQTITFEFENQVVNQAWNLRRLTVEATLLPSHVRVSE